MINVNENPGLISYATEKLEDEPKVIQIAEKSEQEKILEGNKKVIEE